MWIGRTLGFVLLAAAVLAAGAELVRSLEAGRWLPIAAGQLWQQADAASLAAAEAAVGGVLAGRLWPPLELAVLQQPVWAVAGLPGLALWLFCRPRSLRRRSSARR